MRVPAAEFVKSARDPADWPDEGLPEIAFAGRSNVGKSSLINVLVARRGLVRTSATPGRTRLLNFLRVEVLGDDGRRQELSLVDLPGFGYAKVSKEERAHWRESIERYFTGRRALRAVVLIVDARRGPEIDERELAPWLAERGVAVVPVMTKADKLAKHERRPALDAVRAGLGLGAAARPVVFSATTGEGRDELWSRLLAAVAPG